MVAPDERANQILGIEFDQGGIAITYRRLPADVRENGLVWHHMVQVPDGSYYDNELTEFYDAAHALLDDVLDDEGRVPHVEIPTEEEEEEDETDE